MGVQLSRSLYQSRPGHLLFYCPGCSMVHGVFTQDYPESTSARWNFDGNVESPTFSPSIIVTIKYGPPIKVCHSFVRNGKIEFLSDCYHSLASQTVDLPDFEW
jgi:hypothetical protein